MLPTCHVNVHCRTTVQLLLYYKWVLSPCNPSSLVEAGVDGPGNTEGDLCGCIGVIAYARLLPPPLPSTIIGDMGSPPPSTCIAEPGAKWPRFALVCVMNAKMARITTTAPRITTGISHAMVPVEATRFEAAISVVQLYGSEFTTCPSPVSFKSEHRATQTRGCPRATTSLTVGSAEYGSSGGQLPTHSRPATNELSAHWLVHRESVTSKKLTQALNGLQSYGRGPEHPSRHSSLQRMHTRAPAGSLS